MAPWQQGMPPFIGTKKEIYRQSDMLSLGSYKQQVPWHREE